VPSSSASATPTTATFTTGPIPTGTVAATTPRPAVTPTGPALAHTGASVVPYAGGAAVLLAVGAGTLAYSRRARSTRGH
jgi:hypothetical protein